MYTFFFPSPASRLRSQKKHWNIGYVKTVNCCSHEPSIGRKISNRQTSMAALTASRAAPATSTTSAPKATHQRKRSNGWGR